MGLFWQCGYDAVSFDDLIAKTGASRKGLYSVWPDKRALFVAALGLYRRRVGDHFFPQMERPDAGLAAVAGFLDRFEAAARAPGWRGCLVVRTSVDAIVAEPPVAEEVSAYCDRLAASLEHALKGAARRGELACGVDPLAASRQVFAVAVACSVLGVREGFGPRIAALIEAARAACGLSVKATGRRQPAAASIMPTKRRKR